MPLILLDAQGQVVGLGDDRTGGPPWAQGLSPGTPLLRQLQGQAAQAPGPDVQALCLGLTAVLQRRQRRFEQRPAGSPWAVQVRACSHPGPVAAVISFEGSGEESLRTRLTAAERRLAAVQVVAGLGSWYVDVHSGRVQWSPETYRVLGLDPMAGPLDSAAVRSRVHPDDLPRLRADRARVYAGEPLVTSHFRFRRDDGRECWLESRVTLEPAVGDRPAGIVGTVRDVSESAQAQLALWRERDPLEDLVVGRTLQPAAASAKTEAAARMRSSLLAHTSHEIRTPLNVIVSLSHLLRVSLDDSAQQGRARAVEQAARHLGAVIDDLLALAHGEAPPGRDEGLPLDPAALLAEVVAILGPQAATRGLQLQVQVQVQAAPDLAGLRGDVPRLRQVLLNAVGWTLAGAVAGTLRLRAQLGLLPAGAASRAIGPPEAQRALRLFVDCEGSAAAPGPGQPVDRDPDFDPQWQALQRLVRQMNGQLQLDSALAGSGRSSLRIELPVLLGDEPPAAAARAAEPLPGRAPLGAPGQGDAGLQIRQRHPGRRVLLAEDDDVNQMAMQELLADVGLQVDTAVDGHEAVDLASRRAYALILLDLRMPRLDGLGAARAIRALPDHHATPMVAITANTFDEDRLACRQAGMNDFMAKPVEVPRLYALLLHWLDRGGVGPAGAETPLPPLGAAVAGGRSAMSVPPELPAPAAPPGSEPKAAAVAPAAALDPMRALLGLEGLDALGGLASVGGKPAVYRRLLQVFIDTHAGDGDRLLQLLQAGDAGAAGALAHHMRGSAATLGLIDVEVAAAALEGAIDQPTPDAPLPLLAQAVCLALRETLQRLRAALSG